MAAELRDSDLVARARAGDRLAVSSLLERHRPLAQRLAARLLGDPVEAEDVAQEASLQAWLSLERPEPGAHAAAGAPDRAASGR